MDLKKPRLAFMVSTIAVSAILPLSVFAQSTSGSTSYLDFLKQQLTQLLAQYQSNAANTAAAGAAASSTGTTIPPSPLNLYAVSSTTGIFLRWGWTTPKDVGIEGYHVYRDSKLVKTTRAHSFSGDPPLTGVLYTYSVTTFDALGNESLPVSVTASEIDLTPPSIPAALTANPVSMSEIDLSWAASRDNAAVANYEVFRNGTVVTSVSSSSPLVYKDAGLFPGNTYLYSVEAIDTSNNISSAAVVSASTLPDTIPPSVTLTLPANGSTVSGSSVTVSANATDTIGVAGVQFKLDGANLGTEIPSAPFTFTWNTLGVPNGVHTLSALARDAASNYASSSGTVTVSNAPSQDTSPPTTPRNLRASVASTSVSLSWTASNDNVAVVGYRISRGGTLVSSTTALKYKDTGLTPSTPYSYSVVAYDAAGNVSTASTASVTTAANSGRLSAPYVSISASKTNASSGDRVTLSWSGNHITSCVASGGWSGNKSTTSSEAVVVLTTQTYAISCSGPGGSAERGVTITVVPPADIVFSGQARSAASFLDSIAINTHMGYANTLYLDANLVERSLSYLGIKYVRDGVPPYAMKIPRYQGGLRLAADGYKINYVMGTADPAALNTLDRVAKAYPSSTASVEGRNEVNCWRGLWNNGLGLPGILQDQKALEAAIHGDSYLKGVPVLNLTLCYPSKALYSSLGNMTGAADAGSAHIYAPYGQPPFYDWNGIYAVSAIPTPGLPMVITETGYTTLTSATSSVDEAVQAKYTLDIYADAAKSGAQRTYLYELLDLLPDLDYQHHFGLFRNDGTPKPAAVAVHNLTTILADTVAPQGPTGSLTYTVSNVPQQGNTFLLQKDSGAYDIVVWNEPQLWNYRTKQESPAPAAQSVVTLPSTYQTVKVFDPLQSSDPVQTLSNVSQITVVVQGSPVIIEIGPNTTADITPPSLPTNLTAVTGATSAALSWSASGDNVGVVGYRVYRNTMLVGTTTVPLYLDSGLMPNTLYGYSIIAYDAAGNTSYPATYSLYTPLK